MTYLRKLHDQDVVDNMKIDSQNYFELVYLRHRYFRKSKNPEPGRLEQFEEMICNISDKAYINNYQVFQDVGFEMEDLRNIARVHTISFISMSGLKENPDKMQAFTEKHKNKFGKNSEPGKMDLFKHECYNLARFLKQRMQEVARFSKGKNKNIRGTINQRGFFIGNPKHNPSDIDLFSYPETYGYKLISERVYKEIVKENNAKGKRQFLTKDNKMVRIVHLKGSKLTASDISNLGLDPRSNSYYKNPEDTLIEFEKANSRYMEFLEEEADRLNVDY